MLHRRGDKDLRGNVTAAVVTWNAAGIADILAETLAPLMDVCRVVVSDNCSDDGTPELLRGRLRGLEVLENPANGGFGYGNNRVLENCDTEYLLLLNADARLSPEGLAELVRFLERKSGAAGVQPLIRLWHWPLITLSAGCSMTERGYGYDMDFMHFQPLPVQDTGEVPCITAAVSLWRTDFLSSAGGFDERMFMYFEDIDLSLRVRGNGGRLFLTPSVTARHMSGTSSRRSSAEGWELRSAAYLASRYLGGGQLPPYWKRAEYRAVLGSILRGRPWLRKLRETVAAGRIGTEPVDLPAEVLSSVLAPRPLRMPNQRPPAQSRSNIRYGKVEAGPGWYRGATGPWGFGCLSLQQDVTAMELRVRSPGMGGSVALWSDGGLLDRTFIGRGCSGVLSGELSAGSARAYLVPDRNEQVLELEDANI